MVINLLLLLCCLGFVFLWLNFLAYKGTLSGQSRYFHYQIHRKLYDRPTALKDDTYRSKFVWFKSSKVYSILPFPPLDSFNHLRIVSTVIGLFTRGFTTWVIVMAIVLSFVLVCPNFWKFLWALFLTSGYLENLSVNRFCLHT